MMSLEFLIAAFIVVLIPGTGVVYTVAVGLGGGRRASVAAALGCTLGIVPAIAASLLGLSTLMHTSALAFQAVKYAGVAYLFYLAWRTVRETGPMSLRPAKDQGSGLLAVATTGMLINVLNPKLTVFFLAFLPQFVTPGRGDEIAQMASMSGVFMAMTFAVFLVYGQFAGLVGARVLNSERALAWMRRSVAATFVAFGFRLTLAEQP